VKILRLGVGIIGILLPIVLIVGNWIVDWKVSWPSSMSSSYYTHTRVFEVNRDDVTTRCL